MENRAPCPVIDAHVDLLYDLLRHHPETGFEDLPDDAWINLPKLASGGVRVMVSAFYCEDSHNGPGKAADNLRFLLEYSEKYLRAVQTIHTGEELAACFHGAGPPGALRLLENADALLEYPPEILKSKGFRIVGLTHVGKNRIGDGNKVPDPGGLTREGRSLVRELDRLGFALDIAHLSEPCFREVADTFAGPILSSHTGLRSFCDTPRNLSDEQLRIIFSRGGVIGLAAFPGMLSASGRADSADVFRQIEWLVQKFGADGVAVGSDFGGYDTECLGFEDHSRLPELTERLTGAGYPDRAIAGILGGNWFRFFSSLLER
jgi:membrane dipeptidase